MEQYFGPGYGPEDYDRQLMAMEPISRDLYYLASTSPITTVMPPSAYFQAYVNRLIDGWGEDYAVYVAQDIERQLAIRVGESSN